MALTQITYNDKSNYQSSSLANEYKVSASDMNEIKSVVNGACTQVDDSIGYSTTETAVGTWIDGKTIYRKVVDCGALPNATNKAVNHNISNLDTFTSIKGFAKNPNTKLWIPLPYIQKTYVNYAVEIYVSDTQIIIGTQDNKSGYSQSYMVLEYTKTS